LYIYNDGESKAGWGLGADIYEIVQYITNNLHRNNTDDGINYEASGSGAI